jgi:hypothetical protein
MPCQMQSFSFLFQVYPESFPSGSICPSSRDFIRIGAPSLYSDRSASLKHLKSLNIPSIYNLAFLDNPWNRHLYLTVLGYSLLGRYTPRRIPATRSWLFAKTSQDNPEASLP